MIHYDAKTGIQRVVRQVLDGLRSVSSTEYRIVPVYALPGRPGYRAALGFGVGDIGKSDHPRGEPVQPRAGDIFLGLDLAHDMVLHQSAYYVWLRQIGVQVYFVVYDLLPILMPHYFDFGGEGVVSELHRKWLAVLAQQDGIISISRTVADETCAWLDQFGPERSTPLQIGWFHLGRDMAAALPDPVWSNQNLTLLQKLSGKAVFLMVGTLEPRKGHAQTLAAFDLLWQQGSTACLVMVGKGGWQVDALLDRIQQHPELNRKLFWLDQADDALLAQLYQSSACLIYASEGEGFGLPLIEAADHGLALLVRDLPVFREIVDGHAQFFPNATQPEPLATAITDWLALYGQNKHPQSINMAALTWQQSAQQLLETLRGKRWYRQWSKSSNRIEADGAADAAGHTHHFNGRVFFDHQPGVAGEVINVWFADILGDGSIVDNLCGNQRELIAQYGGQFPVLSGQALFSGEGLGSCYQYITLLREPVERALCWLHALITHPVDERLRCAALRVVESEGRYIHPELLASISNVYVTHFAGIAHSNPLGASAKVAAALQAIRHYAVVGLYDDLPRFTRDIAEVLNLPWSSAAIHAVADELEPERISPALRERLTALNQLDSAFYNEVSAWKRATV